MEPRVSVTMILQAASAAFGVSMIELRSARRGDAAVRARFAACLLARELTELSYPQVGRSIGIRDHATILHAARRAAEMRAADPDFRQRYDDAKAAILWLAGSTFADQLRDEDAVQIAARIIDRPASAVRVSNQQLVALAVRLVTLEELAAGTCRLIAGIDQLTDQPTGADTAQLRDDVNDSIDGVTSMLVSLGYATITSAGDAHV